MFARTLSCGVAVALGLMMLTGLSASAGGTKDKKDKPGLSGVWELKGAQLVIEFADKNVMKIAPHGDSKLIAFVCKYAVDKEGAVKVKVTDLEGKDEIKQKAKEALPVGTEFRFTWKVTDNTAKLSDIKADNAEHLKAHLEGDYGRKK
jgi:hypothetical protein